MVCLGMKRIRSRIVDQRETGEQGREKGRTCEVRSKLDGGGAGREEYERIKERVRGV